MSLRTNWQEPSMTKNSSSSQRRPNRRWTAAPAQQRACQRPCPKTGRTQTRRQLRNLHSFLHRHTVMVDDLHNRTPENPSWEKTSNTNVGTATGTSAALSKSCTVPTSKPSTTTDSETTLSKNCTTQTATAPTPSGNKLWGSRAPP